MGLEFVNGNILTFCGAEFIVHQCNCRSTRSAGLAKALFEMFPEANCYINNEYRRIPGTIQVVNRVINLFGQDFPGRPNSKYETSKMRLLYFEAALEAIHNELPNLQSVAFPQNIGCGLAGGDWKHYFERIKIFSEKLPNVNVFIVCL